MAGLARGGGHPHVAAHRQRHPREPGERREQRAHQEERAAAPPHRCRVRREKQEHEEDRDDEDADGAELAPQVGRGTLLDRPGDLLHLFRALAGGEHFPHQPAGHGERQQRDHGDDDNPGQVGAAHAGRPTACGELEPIHLSSLTGHTAWVRVHPPLPTLR